ncbi:MAG: N-acetylglucosamine-6-phosphate deacetylase, partial [Cyanobacteria bacterium J06642_3]
SAEKHLHPDATNNHKFLVILVNLQINGGLGLAFPDLEFTDLPKLQEICDYLWHQGVDAFLPTIVTTSITKIQRSLSVIKSFLDQQAKFQQSAEIIGVHLEGPFLNIAKKGAHPAEFLLPLNIDNLEQVLGDYAEIVKIMTLAPELDPSGKAIKFLRSHNITVSLGHSLATETEARQAFELGASMITHSFNAMPSLHHREPGLLGAAITDQRVSCGLIADGQHVSPTMLKILLNSCEHKDQVFLVSDALAPIGLPDGVYPWDSREIFVKDGTARLESGTLSGTTLPLLQGVQNLVKWNICEPARAIALATESPRQAIGLKGLKVGQEANLLRWKINPKNHQITWRRL